MAQVIYGDEGAMFDALAFSVPHPGTVQFIADQASRFSSNLNQAGQAFVQAVHGVFEWVDQSKAMQLARMVGKKVEGLWQQDIIRPLIDIPSLQTATLTMQRWVMACPDIRALYHTQECEGYVGSYVDMDPGKIGEQHYDYRRAVDGLVMFDEESDDWQATTYFEDLREGDRDLLLDEQVDIQSTWAAIRAHVKARKDDPTSLSGASL